MTVPVTVIGSAVACFLSVGFGCANAKGASSKQARATVFFIICLPVDVNRLLSLYKGGSGPRAARNFRFFPSLAFLLRIRFSLRLPLGAFQNADRGAAGPVRGH